MNSRYWWILLTYIIMQLSSFIGLPLLLLFEIPLEMAVGIWTTLAFSVGLLVIILFLRKEITERHLERSRSTRGEAVLWSIIGVFLAFFAQYVAAIIELFVLGIEPGSENTENIIQMIKAFPALIVVVAVIGPILEEIVFRLIIFGSLYKRYNFFISAMISSLIFAAVHVDFTHLLIYTAMGFTFAYLYVKTKRILVPIVAHVAMNSFVTLTRVVYGEQLEELQRQLEQMQQFIGGFL
ncbi:CPBP family intramembrane glutamic endopeptidase [Bacillus alkalicellulosilyticus]|uniref:CPBP family intramembrane glutamic endopeptidase n=1 Tax=Alkalihalobacterium alkalicellulosilyticum TaxID=1912214 RepID=UPI0011174B93|nr:type II CAAX endopeptidase family protein [Bacillus alkalicellulosilyticus]